MAEVANSNLLPQKPGIQLSSVLQAGKAFVAPDDLAVSQARGHDAGDRSGHAERSAAKIGALRSGIQGYCISGAGRVSANELRPVRADHGIHCAPLALQLIAKKRSFINTRSAADQRRNRQIHCRP